MSKMKFSVSHVWQQCLQTWDNHCLVICASKRLGCLLSKSNNTSINIDWLKLWDQPAYLLPWYKWCCIWFLRWSLHWFPMIQPTYTPNHIFDTRRQDDRKNDTARPLPLTKMQKNRDITQPKWHTYQVVLSVTNTIRYTKTKKQLFIWRTQPKRHTYKMVLWITSTKTIHYTKTQNHDFSDAGWKQNLNNWYLGRHTNLVISRHQDGSRAPIKRLGPHLWSPTIWQSPNMSLQDRKDQISD